MLNGDAILSVVAYYPLEAIALFVIGTLILALIRVGQASTDAEPVPRLD